MGRFTADTIIIGAGQAGVPLARALAEAGRRTVLIERKHAGGSCVNFGCTPSKAFIASAMLAHQARRGAEYGLKISAVEVDFPAVMARARAIVAVSRSSLETSLGEQPNLKVVMATGTVTGQDGSDFLVEAAGDVYAAPRLVLDTGTREADPGIEGLKGLPVLTGTNWIDNDVLPGHLVILGGGAIAVEMAQAFRRLGSDVTMVERGPRILGNEDPDVSETLTRVLQGEGIVIRTGIHVLSAGSQQDGVGVRAEGGQIGGTHLFVATGRQANTDGMGLETLGIVPGTHGIIAVDQYLRTSRANVWAAGDIRGGPQFTNTAYDDYLTLRSQLMGDGHRTRTGAVDYAVFSDPELGRVGLDETQAKANGIEVEVGRYRMSDNGKARELGKTEGFIKVLAERGSRRIVGATALCEHGSEVVQLFTELIASGADTCTMVDALHIHPTLAEAAKNAVTGIDPR